MNLDCPRKEFFEAVSAANQAATTRTAINILQCLKLEATGDGLRVSGCDGEMWVVRQVPAAIREEGAICIPSKTLNDIVAQFPDGDISISTIEGNAVMVKQGASEYRLPTLDVEDFPEPPDFGGEGELSLPMADLKAAVDSVLFAVSTDTHRQVLTGVLFLYDGEVLTLVATDTHRLAVRKVIKEGLGSAVNVIVPDKALKAIKLLPVAEDAPVTILFGGGRLGVEADGAKVVSQVLNGTYPAWQRVVPGEHTRVWLAEVDQLSQKLKRMMILARDNAGRVRFKGEGDQIVLASRSEDKGEAKEEVTMVPTNGDVEIAFNGKYVLDYLAILPGPGVRIEMTESTKPAVLRSADDTSGSFCVIMPMALA